MLRRKSQPSKDKKDEAGGFDSFDLRLGDMMRGERATMGKSLLDVQRELKIKATYIAAVENSDPSVFETPGFIAGYVRSYARYLGMDPDWAFKRFCEESGFAGVEGLSSTKSTRKETPARGKSGGEDAIVRPVAPYAPIGESVFSRIEPGAIGSVAILFALIGLIGYGGYSVLQEVQRVQFAPVDQSPGLTADVSSLPSAPGTQNTDLATGFIAPTPDALDRLYRPQALEAPVLTARDGPIAAIDPNANGSFIQENNPRAMLITSGGLAGPDLAASEIAQPQVLAEGAADVVLFATRPAWVRVANADGTVLFEKILDTGERYVLPATDETPILRAGNSGSLFFSVKGQTYGPAGPGTSVAKNVPLGVEAISEAYAIVDPAADETLAEVLKAMADTPLVVDPDAPIFE